MYTSLAVSIQGVTWFHSQGKNVLRERRQTNYQLSLSKKKEQIPVIPVGYNCTMAVSNVPYENMHLFAPYLHTRSLLCNVFWIQCKLFTRASILLNLFAFALFRSYFLFQTRRCICSLLKSVERLKISSKSLYNEIHGL